MRRRLLFVIIDLDGGTATYCRTLAAALRRYFPDDFELALLLMRNRGIEPRDHELFHEIHAGRSLVHGDLRRYYETLVDAGRLRSDIKRIRPDLLLTVGTYASLLVPFVAGSRPVVVSVHTPLRAHLRESRFGGIIRRLLRWRYPRSRLVVPAEALATELREDFGAQLVRVIPHGVDLDRIDRMAADRPAGRPAEQDYIVACGRLTPAKDYPTLLRAYAAARQRGLDWPLLILGDGELRGALRDLARQLHLDGAVRFMGHCDNPFAFMKGARFLAQSSVWEGFGLALLEALALSLPVIATDCPSGPAEILDHGRFGLLVPPGDPDALADAMLQLASSPSLRDDLAARARERAEQLSLKTMAARYADLFQQVQAS